MADRDDRRYYRSEGPTEGRDYGARRDREWEQRAYDDRRDDDRHDYGEGREYGDRDHRGPYWANERGGEFRGLRPDQGGYRDLAGARRGHGFDEDWRRDRGPYDDRSGFERSDLHGAWYDAGSRRFGEGFGRAGQGPGSYGQGRYGAQRGYGRPGGYGQGAQGGRYGSGSGSYGTYGGQGGYGSQGGYGGRRGYGFDRGLGGASSGGAWSRPPFEDERYGDRGFRESEDPERGGDESWGQQLREAGDRFARGVKRVFRGTKGYSRSDERIREDVNDRLSEQDELDPSDIEVMVSGGEVTLTGTVQSRYEKFWAEEIADDVSGVRDVHNQLRVRRDDPQQPAQAATGGAPMTAGTQSQTQPESAQRNRNAPRA